MIFINTLPYRIIIVKWELNIKELLYARTFRIVE